MLEKKNVDGFFIFGFFFFLRIIWNVSEFFYIKIEVKNILRRNVSIFGKSHTIFLEMIKI